MSEGSNGAQGESARWFELTDQYAAAVAAFSRGEPRARERLQAAFTALKLVPQFEQHAMTSFAGEPLLRSAA